MYSLRGYAPAPVLFMLTCMLVYCNALHRCTQWLWIEYCYVAGALACYMNVAFVLSSTFLTSIHYLYTVCTKWFLTCYWPVICAIILSKLICAIICEVKYIVCCTLCLCVYLSVCSISIQLYTYNRNVFSSNFDKSGDTDFIWVNMWTIYETFFCQHSLSHSTVCV